MKIDYMKISRFVEIYNSCLPSVEQIRERALKFNPSIDEGRLPGEKKDLLLNYNSAG